MTAARPDLPDDALRALAEAATPGPWEDFAFSDGSVFVERIGEDDDDSGNEVCALTDTCNAAFIAAANPATVLALLNRLAALTAEVETAREAGAGGEAVTEWGAYNEAIGRIVMIGCDRAEAEGAVARSRRLFASARLVPPLHARQRITYASAYTDWTPATPPTQERPGD